MASSALPTLSIAAVSKHAGLTDPDTQSTVGGGGDSSDKEDMTTECSESSRLSSCRSAAQRSTGRKEKKRLAYLAHCKEQAKAQGLEWKDPTAREQYKADRMLVPATNSDDGIAVAPDAAQDQSTVEELLKNARSNKMQQVEQISMMVEYERFSPQSLRSSLKTLNRVIRSTAATAQCVKGMLTACYAVSMRRRATCAQICTC